MSIPSDEDKPVTERICELKRKDVSAIGETIKDFREDFNSFKNQEFSALQQSLTAMTTNLSKLCNEVGQQKEWQSSHETSHTRSTKLLGLVGQWGSWLVAIISLLLLGLLQAGIIGSGSKP